MRTVYTIPTVGSDRINTLTTCYDKLVAADRQGTPSIEPPPGCVFAVLSPTVDSCRRYTLSELPNPHDTDVFQQPATTPGQHKMQEQTERSILAQIDGYIKDSIGDSLTLWVGGGSFASFRDVRVDVNGTYTYVQGGRRSLLDSEEVLESGMFINALDAARLVMNYSVPPSGRPWRVVDYCTMVWAIPENTAEHELAAITRHVNNSLAGDTLVRFKGCLVARLCDPSEQMASLQKLTGRDTNAVETLGIGSSELTRP